MFKSDAGLCALLVYQIEEGGGGGAVGTSKFYNYSIVFISYSFSCTVNAEHMLGS